MGQRWRSKGKAAAPAGEDEAGQCVTFPSSSDDEEANEDLSLAIVEKARQRKSSRKRAEDGLGPVAAQAPVIDLLSAYPASSDAGIVERVPGSSAGGLTSPADGDRKKKLKKLKKKKKQQQQVEEKEPVGSIVDEEKTPSKGELVITGVNEASDNLVFRKLLRGPRYFDPGERNWETCFNCGEEGHIAANCMMEKRQKPCFVCGLFGHYSKQCLQGQACFVCKRRGHLAKDCPDKNKKITQDSEICLRCGETGHVMSSCRNDYLPDDLKEMQCYICKKYGHLCCVNLMDTGPREVSCYNCAQPGHTGLGCAKPRGDSIADASPAICYICYEEGHFARGCTTKKTKFARKMGESSTLRTFDKENRRSWGAKSVPRDFGKERKKKSLVYEERRNMTTGKSKIKGGWIVDDPGDPPRKKFRVSNYASPMTPVKKSHRNYSPGFNGHSSNSHAHKKWKPYIGTPGSHASKRTYHREFSA